MARKYVNPAGSATPVTDDLLEQARARAAAAAERLRDAERADPAQPGWEPEYTEASAAVRATSRRLEALEQARASAVERAGQRVTAVKAAQGDLKAMASALAASRDAVAAAAAEHLAALVRLELATGNHNALVADSRARLAAAGIQVRDDLADGGQDHPEGALDQGVRVNGTDWIPVPHGALAAHACRQVFAARGPAHPLSQAGKHVYRAHEVEARGDGLRVPVLADAALPPVPERARAVPAPHEPIPPALAPQDGIYRDPPRRGKAAR